MEPNRNRKTFGLIVLIMLVIPNLTFAQLFGGQIKTNKNWSFQYPSGSVFCSLGPTAVVDVLNPTTGKTWMDRNLGASQAATSSTDPNAYGDLYQWGRRSDGHQCRNSGTTTTLSSSDQPNHGLFITLSQGAAPYDWRTPQNNNLWQGGNGINNPCPSGYRLPTFSELNDEINSWSAQNNTGAFSSPLKLPLAGSRLNGNGAVVLADTRGYYWSSTSTNGLSGFDSFILYFTTSSVSIRSETRALGQSVRCIKN